jgi:hypothetical protein
MSCCTHSRWLSRQLHHTQSFQACRTFHTTHRSFAKPAARPSPRVRAAQRVAKQGQSSAPRQGFPSRPAAPTSNRPTTESELDSPQHPHPWMPRSFLTAFSLPAYETVLIKEICALEEVTESVQRLKSFMEEWEVDLGRHQETGPWMDEVVNSKS